MAGSAQGIRAGRAFVELFADDTKLVRGLRAAERKLKAFGSSVQTMGKGLFAMGASVVTPLLAATNVFSEMGDQLAKMSGRTGISVEALSELGYAAEQSGADMSTFEGGVRRMQKFLQSAAEGSTAANGTLAKLGVRFSDLAGMTPDQQFEALAQSLSQVANPTTKAALAMELFGKSGTSLLPMMQDGAKGIQELRDQARDLGLVISTEDAKAAEIFGDRLSDLWKVIKSGVFAIGAALAPLLIDLTKQAIRIAKTIADWIRENKALVVTVFKIAAAVAAGGAAIFALGALISGVGAAFGVAATIITGIGTVLATMGTIVAALLSPIGLVSAAVIGLGAYLLYVSGAGSEALAWLADTFQSLKDEALAAGDLALAAKILWLTLRMEWQKGVAFLEEHWIRFKEFFVSLAADAFYGVVSLMVDAWAGMQVAWVETTAFMSDAWTIFTSSLTKGWSTAQNFISKGVLQLMKLFDSELDVEGASQILDGELQKRNASVDQQMQQQIGASDQQRTQKRSQIETDRQGAQTEVTRMADEERQAREQQNTSDIAASADALTQARQEWEAAIAEAAQKRKDVTAPEVPERLRKAQDNLAGMEDNLVQVRDQRLSTTGTFNAAAVRGMGGGSADERTARATEATAQSVKKMEERSRLGQPTFS